GRVLARPRRRSGLRPRRSGNRQARKRQASAEVESPLRLRRGLHRAPAGRRSHSGGLLDRMLSEALGREVTLAASAPEAATFEEVWPAVKGSQLYGNVLPQEGEEVITDVPAGFAAPSGTLFDFSAIHLLTTNTLDRLRELAPESRFVVRRFRPNIVVQIPQARGFVENDW